MLLLLEFADHRGGDPDEEKCCEKGVENRCANGVETVGRDLYSLLQFPAVLGSRIPPVSKPAPTAAAFFGFDEPLRTQLRHNEF
jgi:hypothetical protein